MAIEYNTQDYGSSKGILVFPDHYVAVGVKHAKGTSGTPGLSVLVDGRYIVKAGTIYPANDATALGVVLSDVDVTNGDGHLAVIIHGFIKLAALPAVPSAAALGVLHDIHFLPIAPFVTISLAVASPLAVDVDATDVAATVVVAISNASFRDAAETLTNWTITGEATSKLEVTAAVLSSDKRSITLTVESTAAAVAGDITVRPAASVVSLNSQPAAVTIATVS